MTTVQPGSDRFGVLIVCTANICRSPMAQYLLRMALLHRDPMAGARFAVRSAGTRGWDEAPMDTAAAAELRRLGGDPAAFRSRPLDDAQCRAADLVLTATREHRTAVLHRVPRALRRTFTILEFADLAPRAAAAGSAADVVAWAAAARASATLDDYDVPDPYRGSPEEHRGVADLIESATTAIASALLRR